MMTNGHGGQREGAGRPKGWRKPEGTREQHQIRAYADEWTLIQAFARMVKHGRRDECEKFIQKYAE